MYTAPPKTYASANELHVNPKRVNYTLAVREQRRLPLGPHDVALTASNGFANVHFTIVRTPASVLPNTLFVAFVY